MSAPLGTFAAKQICNTYSRTTDGSLETNVHFEGEATDLGSGFGTLSLTQKFSETGATSGTCTWAGQVFQPDGTPLGAVGDGTWEQKPGKSTWDVTILMNLSNGDRLRSVGAIDLATRSYKGEYFSAS